MSNNEEPLRRMRGEDRRSQILEVATQVFGQRGYRGSALRDVADACGVTEPLVYKYFRSKRDLFLAAVEYAHELTMRAWEEASAKEANALGKLRALGRVYEGRTGHELSLGAVLQARAEAGRDEAVRDVVERYFRQHLDLVRQLIDEAASQGAIGQAVPRDALAWQLVSIIFTTSAVSDLTIDYPGAAALFEDAIQAASASRSGG